MAMTMSTPSHAPLDKVIPLLVFPFMKSKGRELADMGTVWGEIQNLI